MPTTGKKKSGAALPATIKPGVRLPAHLKPNRHSVVLNPTNRKQPTKAEMYEDLKKAVENTK